MGEASMDPSRFVPERSGDWRARDRGEVYDGETIFKYMDGAAEVFLSYSFRSLFVRRFSQDNGTEITVELYDMGGSADAFGIFSRHFEGGEAGVGQGSEFRGGYFAFWRGRYYATLYGSQRDEALAGALRGLAEIIAERIGADGPPPDLLGMLPPAGLDAATARYFHRHTDLNQHYFVSDENVLRLGDDCEAVLAAYPSEDAEPLLLIARYPDTEEAAAAHESFQHAFLPGADAAGVARIEHGGWAAAAREGVMVLAVLDAAARDEAEALLTAARECVRENVKESAR